MLSDLQSRLRELGDRPIPEGEHRGAAIGIFLVLLLLAGGLIALSSSVNPPSPKPAKVAAPAPVAAVPAPTASTTEQPSPDDPVQPSELRAARSAARRFLTGYLPFSYGRGGVNAIAGVSKELRDTLASNPPRVPPAEQRRHARIVNLEAQSATTDRAFVLALISDQKLTYSIGITVERVSGAWQATALRAG